MLTPNSHEVQRGHCSVAIKFAEMDPLVQSMTLIYCSGQLLGEDISISISAKPRKYTHICSRRNNILLDSQFLSNKFTIQRERT